MFSNQAAFGSLHIPLVGRNTVPADSELLNEGLGVCGNGLLGVKAPVCSHDVSISARTVARVVCVLPWNAAQTFLLTSFFEAEEVTMFRLQIWLVALAEASIVKVNVSITALPINSVLCTKWHDSIVVS